MKEFVKIIALRLSGFASLLRKFSEESTSAERLCKLRSKGLCRRLVSQLVKNHHPFPLNLFYTPLRTSIAILCLGGVFVI